MSTIDGREGEISPTKSHAQQLGFPPQKSKVCPINTTSDEIPATVMYPRGTAACRCCPQPIREEFVEMAHRPRALSLRNF